MDVDVLKEGIDVLIRAGYNKNRDALLEEAFRPSLSVKPSIQLEMDVELYKSEKDIPEQGSKIAGTSLEGLRISWRLSE